MLNINLTLLLLLSLAFLGCSGQPESELDRAGQFELLEQENQNNQAAATAATSSDQTVEEGGVEESQNQGTPSEGGDGEDEVGDNSFADEKALSPQSVTGVFLHCGSLDPNLSSVKVGCALANWDEDPHVKDLTREDLSWAFNLGENQGSLFADVSIPQKGSDNEAFDVIFEADTEDKKEVLDSMKISLNLPGKKSIASLQPLQDFENEGEALIRIAEEAKTEAKLPPDLPAMGGGRPTGRSNPPIVEYPAGSWTYKGMAGSVLLDDSPGNDVQPFEITYATFNSITKRLKYNSNSDEHLGVFSIRLTDSDLNRIENAVKRMRLEIRFLDPVSDDCSLTSTPAEWTFGFSSMVYHARAPSCKEGRVGIVKRTQRFMNVLASIATAHRDSLK